MVGPQAPAGSLRARQNNRAQQQSSSIKETVKYKSYSKDADTLLVAKWSPSQLIADLTQPTVHAEGWRPKPQVVELLNIAEHSHKVQSTVPIDQPLFQPYPPEVVFHSYEPFRTYEATLRLRNNDTVARRVAVEALESSCFQVARVPAPGQAVGSKIAAGMETAYKVTFAPESIDSCEQQLVVVTEREKFLVPLLAVGAAAALDLPDSITLPPVAAKKSSRRSLLVTNVGRKAGSFQLACSSACFSVSPARACLAPGETLQLTLDFTPPAPGDHEGELEMVYEDSSRTTFTVLRGQGQQLDVGLSDSQVVFLPTCMGKLSQRSFRMINRSSSTVAFSIRSQPTPAAELAASCTALAAVQQQGTSLSGTGIAAVRGLSGGGSRSKSGRSRTGSSNGSSSQQQQQLQEQWQLAAGMDVEMDLEEHCSWAQRAEPQQLQQQRCSTASSEGASEAEWLVGDAQLAALRRSKRARLDIAADKQLFGTQHFAAFPPEGCVYPNSEQEVVLQFAPDCAEQFQAVAWVEVQGLGERLPLTLLGQGVGAQVVFSYDNVDIGEAFVNTEHCYEVELLNRGKVDAEWVLQPCHTRFGSKFSFSPSSGLLQPGAGQVIAVRLLSDILGQFEESFQLFLTGSSKSVPLVFKGAVVGPQFTLDTQALDYGIMSYGFRYTKEVLLSNTGAIPLTYNWRLADDNPDSCRELMTVLPAKGTVLPYAKQKILVEFQPQSVQRFSLSLVMDIPRVADGAVKLPVQGECAVPVISLGPGGDLLQFGQVFLRHPYCQQFTLVNDSKLPAKVEVLSQDQPSQSLGTFTATPAAATIPAKGTCTISLSLEAARLGRLQLPVLVHVAGSRNKPLQLIADATAVGPSLDFAVVPPNTAAAHAPAAAEKSSAGAQLLSAEGGTGVQQAAAGLDEGVVAVSADGGALLAEASSVSGAASVASTSVRGKAFKRSAAGSKSKAGSKAEPLPLEWTAAPAICFGKVQVLQQHVQELRLRNTTLIDADVKLFVEGRDSVFKVEPREAVVPAGGELSVLVHVVLDDTTKFKDVLHALVAEGADVNIPLEATGVGNTLVSEVLSQPKLDVGAQFVGRPWQLEFTVANMGRKAASLTWSNSKLAELARTFGKTAKGTGKKFDAADLPAEQQPVFSIAPDKLLLGPKDTASFLISGISQAAGVLTEQLQCQCAVSGGASSSGSAKGAPVFDITLSAEVAVPLLELSRRSIEFLYTHVRGCTPQTMVETVQAQNVSKLPLQFTVKASSPFSIEPTALSLQPGESAPITFSFDPDFRHDLVSQSIKQRCLISYPDNPEKDWLELSGIIDFPNLLFDATAVDFGCVLMDSMRRVSVGMSNPGRVPVEYNWSWVSQPTVEAGPEGLGTSRPSTTRAPKPAPSQLFDILPIHGILEPGQKEQVEFSFYAFPGVKATAQAVCSVVDGPTYQFQLSGESNSIKYDVTPQFFDCGMQPYDRAVERELFVNNTGKVVFDFSVDLSLLSRQGVVEAAPMSGKVVAGEKARIKLKVKAGVPARLMEPVLVSVAHFEPVQVQVLVEGTYPMLAINLPRLKDDAFYGALQQAESSADDQVSAAREGNVLQVSAPVGPLVANSSFRGAGRQSLAALQSKGAAAFASLPRGSIGPGSIAGGSIAGTVVTALNAGRPGSGAKSQISGVSAKSRASATATASLGAMLAKDKLTQLQASLPADKRLDNEAERIRLVQQLLAASSSSSSHAPSKASTRRSSSASSAQPGRAGATATQQLQSTAAAAVAEASSADAASTVGGSARPLVPPKLPELVSAHYVLDFGSVTKGINKSKKVKLTNMSPQQVSFVVDKQTLEAFGFGMVPEAAIKLAGAPECQSTEVTFTVLSAKARVPAGPLELTLPLLIKGGPAVVLTLRALVVVPEVVPNESLLEFRTVSTGHCKVYTVQLQNPREVPAEWSIKRPAVDSPKLRDWGLFVPEPAEGCLEPGASVNVKVTFTPTLGRELPYSLALPIKVNNNPKVRELQCTGKGYTPRVDFSSKVLDCGAILPRFPGQQPADATLQLRNLGERPLELVCLDLDKQYQADEEALRSLDIYDASGVALLRPLAPGEPTWPELLEVVARRKQMESAAAEAARQAIASAQAALGTLPVNSDSTAKADSAAAAAPPTAAGAGPAAAAAAPASIPEEGVGELEAVPPTTMEVVQAPHRLVVILYGNPLSGTSVQAAALCSRYGLPCVSIDSLLQETCAQAAAEPAAEATADRSGHDSTVTAGAAGHLHEQLRKLLHPQAAQLAAGAYGQPPPVSIAAKNSSQLLQQQQQPPTHAQLTVLEVHEVAVKALQLALSQPQYEAGFVLDGISSKHLPGAAFAARCMLQAVGLQNKALLPAEPAAAGLTSSGVGGKPAKPAKGSRPSSSKPGARTSLVPEVPPAILDLSKPDVWEGTQQVFAVQLQLGKDESCRRFAAAAAAAAARLEAPGLDCAASELLVEASFMAQQTQQQQQAQQQEQPAETATPSMAAQETAGVTASSEVVSPCNQPVDPAFEAIWAAYEQDAAALEVVLGGVNAEGKPISHTLVLAEAYDAQVARDVVGIKFTAGEVSTHLPPVAADKMLLPPPYELRVLSQPPKWPKRLPLTNFKVWTLPAASSGAPADDATAAQHRAESPDAGSGVGSRPLSGLSKLGTAEGASPSPRGKNTPRGKRASTAAVPSRPPSAPAQPAQPEEEAARRGLREATRWVVPPHGSVSLLVQFASDSVGKFSEVLGFDVLCGERNQKVVLTGACDYPRISTEARNLYYKIAKARPSTPNVKQQFMLPSSMFEFGPVLAGRDRAAVPEGHPDHTATFRITNNGLFPLHADFWLKSEGPAADPTAAAAGVEVKKKAAAPAGKPGAGGKVPVAPPFLLLPSSLDLAIDETQELTVLAHPGIEGTFEDVVMCRLRDNPTPLEFPISVIGAKPAVAIRFDQPVGAALSGDAARPGGARERRTSEVGAKTAKPAAVKAAKQAVELTVQFDRLLLRKKDTQFIIISNTGVLPFKWRLAGAEKLPPEFKVYPAGGELAARSDVRVCVEFNALTKREPSELVTLEVLDVQEALGVSRSMPIAIRGEAHDIHVDIRFPQDNLAGLDFGPLRVVDDCIKQLVLKNTEKYEVQFEFAVRSERIKQLVHISPESGVVPPNKEVSVTLHWNKDLSLRQEVALFGNTDILLCLIEPTTDSKEQQVPIKLSADVQFSHYAITPAQGLHFGPNTYNSLSKPRCFEVVNLGKFPFHLRVFDMYDKQNAEAAALKALAEETAAKAAALAGKTQGRKGAAAAAAATAPAAAVLPPPPQGTLQLGQFTVDPPEAVVQPGCRQEVSVVFRAEGNCSWSAVAGLDISERDFVDAPEGIPYELGGESCIPGIDASNIGSIFEEHVVLSNLDPFKPINCSFGLRDKVFNFGTVIAQLDASDTAPASVDGSSAAGSKGDKKPAKAASKQAARASINGPSSTAGSAAGAAAVSLLDEPGAVKANLKFINPIKVPCTVNFSIKPRGGAQPGVRFPMEVFPSSIVIPPHEYRHVTLAFCPKAIQQYSATFEASVVGGGADPATAGFVCELRGEGTLPSLSFQEPSTVDAARRPVLKFGKLLAGHSSQLLVNVRNNGLLPASARIEMDDHPAFTLLEGPQVFTVESKKAATFTVAFNPPEIGIFSHELQLRVKLNPFEQYRVVVTGECIQEDITFAGLPSDTLGVLNLPDVYLVSAPNTPASGTRNARMPQTDTAQPAGAAAAAAAASTSSYTFSLVNNSSSRHYRFKWPEHPQLKFTPSVGHLHARASKDITVVFSAAAPVKLDGQDIKMAVSQISYKGEPIDWDDVLAASMIAAGARASSATRGSTGLPGSGPKPGAEPYVDLVAKTQRDVLLKVFATADSPRYECSAPAPAIVFWPTMMFQTRSFTFSITNSALTALKYRWMVVDKQGNLDESGLYAVAPEAGVVTGGSSQQFTLRFSPTEVEDVRRTIMCHMPVLEQLAATATGAAADAFKQLTREVTGKVLRPWCHFELPDSDYLPAGRRNPELPGPSGVVEPLDPATKVLEFDSLGVRVRNTKQFFILNPTSISYDFVWAPVLPPAVAALGGPPPASPFSCLVRKGTISGGRRYEMVFEFTPTSDVLCESFWTFSIPSQGICVPFLLVGHVLEPRISLDRPAINFGQVQLGVRGKIKFTLNNDEHLPFTFALDKASYDASDALLVASGGKALLDIQPASGTVAANSEVELCAVFAPQAERPINYNVVVRVRNKPTPLVLNVKGEGYALQPSLLLELPDDSSLEMSPSGVNNLDYGQVVINDRVVKSLALINSGRVNFDYVWELGSNASLSVKPQAGSVPKGERRVVEISYAPTTQEHLAGYPISCQIINGPKYKLVLSGSGYKPKLHFSFLNHNFGPCHVWQQGMTQSSVNLVVQNQDKQAVGIDVLFDNTDNWQVMSSSSMLAPGQSIEVPVSFKPTAAQEYAAVMPLRVNGLYNMNVMLAGEGVPLRVELAKPEQLQRGVSFGAVPCGSSCSRTLALVNRGKAAAFVSFEPSMELFDRLQMEVMPAGGMLLKSHEVAEVTIWYRPKQRMLTFKEPLHALVAGVPQVLATLTGASTGMALMLASDSIPFGTVVLGSRTTKRLQLSNHGDLGCRFAWDVRPLGQQFSISPAEGFLAPGQDVKLEVAFHPTAVNADIRVERIHCRLLNSAAAGTGGSTAELGAAASSDLLLTLTGACVQSEAAGELTFKCNVRTSSSKSITLSNSSSTNWQLRPAIQNEFWSGPEFLQVPAGGSAEYTLVYKPLTMTPAEGQPHEGSVFFPIPDGSGLLYKLYGQSDQPTPEAVVELSLPAKTQHSQTLRVSNWLHKPQRFKVIKELLVGEASTRLEGPTAIDVPALTDRDYKLSVYSFTTGLTHARITFKNEATGEYTFYELKLSSSAAAPMGQLVMECPCFSKTSTTISITNPLAAQVPLKFSCTSKQVSLSQEPPVLAASSTTALEVRFRPLLVGSSEAVLRLDSPELGLYEWRLRLTGAPTNPGRSLGFSVPLGTRDTQVFRFTHWLPDKTDYKCSFKNSASATSGGNVLSNSGFDAPATVTAPAAGPAGVEVECVVGFEPCAVGEVFRDVLLLSSAAAGPYEVPLVGQCVPPKPQGPIDVSKGSAAVPFRNVFASEAEFFYSVDNPAFVVAKPSEKLQPKKPVTITVSYKHDAASKAAATAGGGSGGDAASAAHGKTGKLTVTCPKQTSTQWVFYLQA